MVKADLITGFLGSGKTTFIRRYAEYLLSLGEKICILENDYGAVNVDTMLLSDMKSENLGIEMVAGGCDQDCHIRRFKTKLITMAMLGYDRVIIEPSGIFDVDEFFDILHEDPLDQRYEISNVIAIVRADLEEKLSRQGEYLLASQAACAGAVVFSRSGECGRDRIQNSLNHINSALGACKCKRSFDMDRNVMIKPWDELTLEDLSWISRAGYCEASYEKDFSMDDNGFQSLFFMKGTLGREELIGNIKKLFKDDKAGNVIRVKGFVQDEGHWTEINATKDRCSEDRIGEGQDIIIVIGEDLDEARIEGYFPARYSTSRTGSLDVG